MRKVYVPKIGNLCNLNAILECHSGTSPLGYPWAQKSVQIGKVSSFQRENDTHLGLDLIEASLIQPT